MIEKRNKLLFELNTLKMAQIEVNDDDEASNGSPTLTGS